MSVKTYSPKKVAVTVGTINISGYADGTFVKLERATDAFSKKVGADGEVCRVQSADQSGMVTITLMATSESNAYLTSLVTGDEISQNGVVPITVKELIGNSIYIANNAWVKKNPDAEFGDDLSNVEWVFECEQLKLLHNGSTGFGLPALPI